MADYTDVPPKDAGKAFMTNEEKKAAGLLYWERQAWLTHGLNEGTLTEVVKRSLVRYGVVSPKVQDDVFQGLMAYLSDLMDGVRKQANDQTAAKLAHAGLGAATTQSLIEELHARGGRHADEDSVVLFALTGALLRTLPVEALRGTG